MAKYYIIAGELSGDLHGSNLIREIKARDASADFRGWGGDLMAEQGVTLVKHIKELAIMGIIEVLKNIRTLKSYFKFCHNDILQYNPDVLILVDYPGFNLRIAEFAHKKGYKVFYYISPTVWAWRKSRIKKIKAYVDKMFVIFPFEKKFFRENDHHVDFCGNPLLDALENRPNKDEPIEQFIERNSLNKKKIVAILAGSRINEVNRILPILAPVADMFPDYQFVVAGVNTVPKDVYEDSISGKDVKVIYNQTYELLQQSEAALVASGTASLETALFDVPHLVGYTVNRLTYEIAIRMVNIEFASMVNLILNKEVVKELIQTELTTKNAAKELDMLLNDADYRATMLNEYDKMKELLGGKGASKRVAEIMVNEVQSYKVESS